MTVLDKLNFVSFNPLQNNNAIAVHHRKLGAKIDEQIQLAIIKGYTPKQHKWVTDENGIQRKVKFAKRVRRWWTAGVVVKINHVLRNRSKTLEFAKGKSVIELVSEAEAADALAVLREDAENKELDALIIQQVQLLFRRASLDTYAL